MASSSIVTPPLNTVSTPHYTRPTYLMCPPEWYGVDYVINPWMAGNVHRSSRDLAFAQWKGIHNVLRGVADVRLLHPEPGCPDMVFLSHGALVHHGVAAVSSFTHAQRRPESAHLAKWLQGHGFLLWNTPRETSFEGEGDITFDDTGTHLWAAHGVRTCRRVHRHIADAWHTPITSLHLVDPRFYHLDTALAVLDDTTIAFYPPAFSDEARGRLLELYPDAIEVATADAYVLGLNAVSDGRHVVLPATATGFARQLVDAGYEPVPVDLSELLKGGGSIKCCTLEVYS
jgi:N-dimethylarginine dimethylaminohydrolase